MCLNTTESEQRKNSSAGRPVSFSEKVLNFLATKVWLRTGSWKNSVCLRSPGWRLIPLCLEKPSPTKTVVCCYEMMLSHVKLSITVVSFWSIEFLLLCLASLAQLHVVLYSFQFFAFWYLLFVEILIFKFQIYQVLFLLFSSGFTLPCTGTSAAAEAWLETWLGGHSLHWRA